jgi:3-hydroxyisobutyrate dehydrogenase-like beta-hydroxyacid dehydrogenase
MRVKTWQKDMQVIGDFAKALRVPTPLLSATERIYDTAMTSGYAMADTAAVCAVMEKMAGVKRRRR